MVPTRFAWPYGGRQVFLSGSFTGWREHLLMTPVEGSSTIFQRICNLPPGYHQYKFLVDGVWRRDEQEPFVTDANGVENNIIHVKEPELFPSMTHRVASSSRSNMDLDNGNFQHVILANEVDVSRHRLSELLSSYTAYELLPESGKVFVLDVKVPVKQAFHIMYDEGLAAVPIWDDSKGQFSGMVTAFDFILILMELHKNGSLLINEEREIRSIAAWKEEKYELIGASDRSVRPPYGRSLIQAGPHESLKVVALRLLQNKISSVPIIYSAQDVSHPQLLHLACLSGILKYICRHFSNSPGSLPLLQEPIGRLPLGTWVQEIGRENGPELTLLRSNASLTSALNLFIEAQVSCIPIVNDNGSLINIYSRSDITSLAKDNAYTRIQLDQTSMHDAMKLAYAASGPFYALRRFQTCLRSDSLQNVMERLSDPVVRRLIVIEPRTKRVEGIITLSDVFSFLVG